MSTIFVGVFSVSQFVAVTITRNSSLHIVLCVPKWPATTSFKKLFDTVFYCLTASVRPFVFVCTHVTGVTLLTSASHYYRPGYSSWRTASLTQIINSETATFNTHPRSLTTTLPTLAVPLSRQWWNICMAWAVIFWLLLPCHGLPSLTFFFQMSYFPACPSLPVTCFTAHYPF
jgi:hypothetical protein